MEKNKYGYTVEIVENNANDVARKAEIYLYGAIGDDWLGDGAVGAKDFVDTLKSLGELDLIELHVNSPGGYVTDGVAIYNALLRHSATINVYIDGLAASIASVIAMAGDTITIADTAQMMIHDPATCLCGTAADFRGAASMLDKGKISIMAAYRRHTNLDDNEISELMSAESWFTAAEAVEKGFATHINVPAKAVAMADVSAFNYKHAPRILKVKDNVEDVNAGEQKGSSVGFLSKRLDLATSADKL